MKNNKLIKFLFIFFCSYINIVGAQTIQNKNQPYYVNVLELSNIQNYKKIQCNNNGVLVNCILDKNGQVYLNNEIYRYDKNYYNYLRDNNSSVVVINNNNLVDSGKINNRESYIIGEKRYSPTYNSIDNKNHGINKNNVRDDLYFSYVRENKILVNISQLQSKAKDAFRFDGAGKYYAGEKNYVLSIPFRIPSNFFGDIVISVSDTLNTTQNINRDVWISEKQNSKSLGFIQFQDYVGGKLFFTTINNKDYVKLFNNKLYFINVWQSNLNDKDKNEKPEEFYLSIDFIRN